VAEASPWGVAFCCPSAALAAGAEGVVGVELALELAAGVEDAALVAGALEAAGADGADGVADGVPSAMAKLL